MLLTPKSYLEQFLKVILWKKPARISEMRWKRCCKQTVSLREIELG